MTPPRTLKRPFLEVCMTTTYKIAMMHKHHLSRANGKKYGLAAP